MLAEIERLAINAHERSDDVEKVLQDVQAEEAELEAFQRLRRVADLGADAFMAGMRSRVDAVDAAEGAWPPRGSSRVRHRSRAGWASCGWR